MERTGAVSVLSGVETGPVGPERGRGQPELGRSLGTDEGIDSTGHSSASGLHWLC